jgi:hypothetical protein
MVLNRITHSVVWLLAISLLTAPLACSYKPAYLQKSQKTEISERWKAVKINPAKLSKDEAEVFNKMGKPEYVRFFRHLSLDREKVYEWVYVDPVRVVSFMGGKKLSYVVIDDNLSPFNEEQKNKIFWAEITAGSLAAAGLLYYWLTK